MRTNVYEEEVLLRQVQWLYKENRVDGVLNISRVWFIPKDTLKSDDAGKNIKKFVRFFEMRSHIREEVRKCQVPKKDLRKFI